MNALAAENETLRTKCFMQEKMYGQEKIDAERLLDQEIHEVSYLREKMERKETNIQKREKKWAEFEQYVKAGLSSSELQAKIEHLRIGSKNDVPISNVVQENIWLKRRLQQTQDQLEFLRSLLLQ
jgi:hypothetical protein